MFIADVVLNSHRCNVIHCKQTVDVFVKLR